MVGVNLNRNGKGIFGISALVGIFVALVVCYIAWPFHIVNSGYVGVKLVWGAPQKEILDPGLHWQTPFTTSIVDVNIQPQNTSTNETAATHDLQTANTTVAISYQINPTDAVSFYTQYRTLENMYSIRIAPVVSNDVKEITANYDAQDLVTERQQVDNLIQDRISGDLAKFNIVVSQVNLTNFDFSQAYDEAIEAKQVAYQNSLTAEYSLEKKKVDVQQGVVEAEANAEATIAAAKGQAQATILQAQADSQAYKLKQQTLSADVIAMTYASRWDGHLPTYMTSPVPWFNPTVAAPSAGNNVPSASNATP